MHQSASKPKSNRKTLLLNLVVVVAIFNLAYTFGHREGQHTVVLDGQLRKLQALVETNVVPRRVVDHSDGQVRGE